MNFAQQLKKKTIAYYIGVLGAILGLVALIVNIVYVGMGGTNLPLVYLCIALGIAAICVLFFYDGIGSEIISMIAPIGFTLAALIGLDSDYGNIVDKLNGIRMYGNPDLATFNIVIATLLIVASIFTVVTCFSKKEK
ncbi:MAG: hypothetical protein J6D37_04800 [Clostridia bacterium]|nr:hypothetical protein [Clostridia bacterium]